MAVPKPKKEDCIAAAILIASSCATSHSDVVARKNVDESNPKGNLMGSKIDVGNMYGVFLRSKVIKVVKTFDSIDEDEKQSTTKQDVLNTIETMFQDTQRKSFFIYYSGHGRAPSIQYNRKGGDWVFEGVDANGNKTAEFLGLNEIISLWKDRPLPTDQEIKQKLFIIADCCFSGAWVTSLKEMEAKDIYMQAACGEDEMSMDGQYGGVFTSKYMNSCMSSNYEPTSYWGMTAHISGAMLAIIVAAPVFLIKDVLIKGLYNKATSTFAPVCYREAKVNGILESASKHLTIGHIYDKSGYKYRISFCLQSHWVGMDEIETSRSFTKYATVGGIKNV